MKVVVAARQRAMTTDEVESALVAIREISAQYHAARGQEAEALVTAKEALRKANNTLKTGATTTAQESVTSAQAALALAETVSQAADANAAHILPPIAALLHLNPVAANLRLTAMKFLRSQALICKLSNEDCDDIVNEVMIIVTTKVGAGRYKGNSTIDSYLHPIVRNTAINFLSAKDALKRGGVSNWDDADTVTNDESDSADKKAESVDERTAQPVRGYTRQSSKKPIVYEDETDEEALDREALNALQGEVSEMGILESIIEEESATIQTQAFKLAMDRLTEKDPRRAAMLLTYIEMDLKAAPAGRAHGLTASTAKDHIGSKSAIEARAKRLEAGTETVEVESKAGRIKKATTLVSLQNETFAIRKILENIRYKGETLPALRSTTLNDIRPFLAN